MKLIGEYNKRIKSDKDIGNFLELLYDKTIEYKNPNILELGTWIGSSTITFLRAIDEVGGKLLSVDNRKYKIMDELKNNNVEFIIQDSKNFKNNDKFDIILIDTIHTYNQVKEECNMIKSLIKTGTKIFFHDTIFKPEIIPAIIEFTNSIKCNIKKYIENKGLWEVTILK